ncbi:MAG: hypothetical protein JWP02_1101, partial [Acidimicrobiales bacterium]|nr:hypothetical protein [Acidimicrobiales bacterium]
GTGTGAAATDFQLEVPPPVVAHPSAVVNKDRGVTVSWDRDISTKDLQSYWIWRKGPGDSEFFPIAQTPQVTNGVRMSVPDNGPKSAGGDYVYQLESRRNGHTGDANSFVASNKKAAQADKVTVPNPPPGTPTTTRPTIGPGGLAAPPPMVKSTAGYSPKLSSAPAATTATTQPVTPDPGFVRGLPYAGSNTTLPGEGEGGDAVALTPNGGRQKSNQKGLLVPAATGAILFVGAFQLRWLKKRLDEPITPIT